MILIASNLLLGQNTKLQKFSLKDSILNDNKTLLFTTIISADSNVILGKNKLLKLDDNFITFNDTLKIVDKKSIKQQIKFFVSKKLIKSYFPSDIFNFRSIKEVYGSEITENNQICYFSGVYLIKGSKGNLFYIETKNINGGLIKTLFTEDGFVLWLQLIDRGNWNYSSANVSEFLEKYGIKKDALVEKNLIGVKQIHHFFNE